MKELEIFKVDRSDKCEKCGDNVIPIIVVMEKNRKTSHVCWCCLKLYWPINRKNRKALKGVSR